MTKRNRIAKLRELTGMEPFISRKGKIYSDNRAGYAIRVLKNGNTRLVPLK